MRKSTFKAIGPDTDIRKTPNRATKNIKRSSIKKELKDIQGEVSSKDSLIGRPL